jgi:hypothetical protein
VRDHVRFRSTRFGTEGEEGPGSLALPLAEWLRERLGAVGVPLGEAVVEDWGCLLSVEQEGSNVSLAVGPVTGSDGEWLVFAEPVGPGFFARLFGRQPPPDPSHVPFVTERLDEVLHAEPDFTEISWFEADRRTGTERDYADHPG